MSRLVQSFVHSGWEYKFYSDAQAVDFLSIHFPPEVLEAYNALIPGAFKADLFRYCVLLIHGGFYADIDIQLETSLDSAIAPDIGFMVPMDEVRQYQ
jgi:mannosyltransferase OCH1-like enzyme